MMKWKSILFIFMPLMLCTIGLPLAEANPRYQMQITIRPGDLNYESNARVDLSIEDKDFKPDMCIYVPLEDPAFRRSAEIHSLTGYSIRDQASRVRARVQWLRPESLQPVRPGYWRLTRPLASPAIQLSYELTLPGWRDHPGRPRIITNFYPRILTSCSEQESDELPNIPPEALFELQLRIPESWSQLNPGQNSEQGIRYRGRDFYLVLYQDAKLLETEVEGLRLRFLASSDTFFQNLPAVKQILRHHYGILDDWPTADLLLIESDEFEPVNIAGLVLVNRPQQELMRSLQEDFLNWNTWQMTLALADQWFGHQARVHRLEDSWLTQSLADSLALLFLRDSSEYENLFTGLQGREPWFQLNFSQVQDLLAATLSLVQPHNAMVDSELKSLPDILQRPPYAFIRSSQALRVLLKEMGFKEYSRFLREIFALGSKKALQPSMVIGLLQKSFDRKDRIYSQILQNYWQSDSWPDAQIVKVSKAQDPKATQVQIEFNNELRIPLDVAVHTRDGQTQVQRIAAEDAQGLLVFGVPYRDVAFAEIDPDRSIFDGDRFNNSSDWPDLKFFPGNARTLSDDAYTILWAPFLQKLPGNALSLQLGWQLFRYLGTGLTGSLVHQPKTGRFGYRLLWQQAIPERSLKVNLQVAQDDDRTLPGERLSDLTIQRSPVAKGLPWLDIFSRQRLRQTLGIREESHLTSAFGTVLRGPKRRTCGWQLNTEQELSTWVLKKNFNYRRSFGLFKLNCEVPGFQWNGNVFWGGSKRDGDVPGGALFQPQDLDESRLRLDRPRLPLSGRANTWGMNFAVPLRLPLPSDLLVLPRRSLFKVFADGGQLKEPEHRVLLGGTGLVLPIGGDVIGKQPITFLEFSLLAVFYRKVDGVTDTKPGLLFDFSGQL